MKFDLNSFLQKALKKLGGRYLAATVLAVQLFAFISSGLAIYFIQNNAQFTPSQYGNINNVSLILVVLGNIAMVVWVNYTNNEVIERLDDWAKGKKLETGSKQEALGWKQVNSLPLRFVLMTFAVALLGEVLPVLAYLYSTVDISTDQALYGLLGGLAATFLGSAVAMQVLDILMRPVRKILAPQTFEAQLKNVAELRLSRKLVGAVLAIVIVNILIISPIGHHHMIMAFNAESSPAAILQSYQVQSIIAGIINILLGLALAMFIYRSLTDPMQEMVQTFQKVEKGDFKSHVSITAADEVGELGVYFNHMVDRLDFLQRSLETDVKERTAQLRATVQVSRAVSAILDPDELIERLVNLIADEFGYYYVALFLVDPTERWAELRSATGDAGRVLRQNKHRLDIEGRNMVGGAIRERVPKVAMDTTAGQARFNNPLLPYTRSEIALPLLAGDRVLGALDAQSTRESAFGTEDIETLQAMTSQIATALENAKLFQEAQQTLQDMRAIQQQYLLTAWKNIAEEKGDLYYENGEVEQDETLQEIEIPLILRDQLLGQINLTNDSDWTPEEKSMIEAIASQAALALENARLVEDSQLTARRERMVSEITSKIWSSSTVDGILQTAAREMGRALDTDEVTIELRQSNP